MTDHPITPPPELVKQWVSESNHNDPLFAQVAVMSARWGADQELEACCEWLDNEIGAVDPDDLRAERRPKPPSLKEQALAALNVIEDKMLGPTTEEKLIRKALEALPND